ncbi:MAG: hypothetical protein GX051_08280 [Clostridiales bacterium]|nr:hypothetical protein [Clostridiales bacterium]
MIKNCFSSSVISSSSTSYSTYIAGFAGAFAGSIEDSFFNGTITRSRNGSALVYSEGFNTTVTNSYYIDTVFATAGKSTSMSAERMKSGELCWLLQNGQPDTTVLVWGQSSLTSYPKFYTSENWRVRKVECGDTPYYNIGKVLGDTNGDFTVNSVDLTRFMKASVGFGYADGGLSELTVGDLNSDGTIDAIDAAMLEMAISGGTDYKLQ